MEQAMNTNTKKNNTNTCLTAALYAMGVEDDATRAKILTIGLWWPYYIRLLDETHIPAMIELQKAAGEGQIIDRDAKTLRAHFRNGHEAFGVFHEGRLVAQSLITGPDAAPVQGDLSRHFSKISTMGGVVVAQEARGKGLLDSMIRVWHDHAAQKGADLLHARVRPENEKSWNVFLRNGLSITAKGLSPEGPDHDVYFMYKPLKGALALQDEFPACERGRGGDDISGWLDRGFIATRWNPHQKQFTLAKPAP
jgi:RimJ/RimL family protein N-acetyltransferase